MTRTGEDAEFRDRSLSSDLSRWLGRQGLLRMTLDAVQTIDHRRLGIDSRRPPEFRPQMMLTLLTYCYSSSIYGSRDIEWAIRHDATVRYICARTYPDWEAIRRFRRRHRVLLQECLMTVLKQTWALKFDDGEADYVGYEWFESEMVAHMNAESLDRLDVAALMDSIESD